MRHVGEREVRAVQQHLRARSVPSDSNIPEFLGVIYLSRNITKLRQQPRTGEVPPPKAHPLVLRALQILCKIAKTAEKSGIARQILQTGAPCPQTGKSVGMQSDPGSRSSKSNN